MVFILFSWQVAWPSFFRSMTKNWTLIYLAISSCLLCELLKKLFVWKLTDPNHQFQWFVGGKQSKVTSNVQPEIDGHWVLGCARYICTCNPYLTFQFYLSLGDWHGQREGSTEEFTSLLTCGRLPAKFSWSHLFEIRSSRRLIFIGHKNNINRCRQDGGAVDYRLEFARKLS